MIEVKKTLLGGMNADDTPQLIGDDEYLQLQNGRVAISEDGRNLRVENLYGTTLLNSGLLPDGTNQCIGTAVDTARRRLIYFNWNSNGNHGVYAYDLEARTNYILLLNDNMVMPDSERVSSIVTLYGGGGISGTSADVNYFGTIIEGDELSISVGKDTGSGIIDPFSVSITVTYYETFSSALQRLATAFNTNAIAISYGLNAIVGSTTSSDNAILINFNGALWICESFETLADYTNKSLNFSRDYRIDRNAKVIENLLYWTDNYNPPRKINIEAGIKTNQPTYDTDILPYSLPIDYKWIQWIKRPPIYPLTWEKLTKPNGYNSVSTGFPSGTVNGLYSLVVSSSDAAILDLTIGDDIELSDTVSNNKIFTIGNILSVGATVIYQVVQEVTPESTNNATYKIIDIPSTNNGIVNELFYFGYYYDYYDNELSAVSMLSKVCEYNDFTDSNIRIFYYHSASTFNAINIKVPLSEKIDIGIKNIVFFVKYGQNGVSNKIKILSRDNYNDNIICLLYTSDAADE